MVHGPADIAPSAWLRHRTESRPAIPGDDGFQGEPRRPFSHIGAFPRSRVSSGHPVPRSAPIGVSRAAVSLALVCAASRASAHGFGQRFDLPLPLWLWLGGAGATIVLHFAGVPPFVRGNRTSTA